MNTRPRLIRVYSELKRRRVLGSAAAYVVLAALLIELSDAIFDALLLPDWASRLVTVLFIIGFPVVVVLAWFFDVSAAGLTRTTPLQDRSAPGDPERDRLRPSRDLAEAFRRSHSAAVPESPLPSRHRAGDRRDGTVQPSGEAGMRGGMPAGSVDGDEGARRTSSPDTERVRRVTLGHVRHELRTPINGIIGYAEMLMEDLDEPDLAADLERIRGAGRQLLARVDELLDPGALPPDADTDLAGFAGRVEVDLRTPVNAVVGYAEMLMESCQESGRDHLLPDLERILLSARRLLAASGDIARTAAAARDGSDAPFRTTAALTGELLAKMRPAGRGDGAERAERAERAGGAEGERAGRLLVVDDNETNRDLIARQLARFGYTVATAEDGQQGLDALDRQSFDLVLLDVIMPVLDGVETLQRIQASERHRDTPVIMLSSLDETDAAVRCIELGAWDYLSKPVRPTLLEARIAAALEIRELRRREEAYRRRIAADDDLVDRLLRGSVPASLVERARSGGLDLDVSWPTVAIVRGRLPAELRPGGGSDPVARVLRLRELLARLETVARTHRVDALLWRADGFLAVLGTDAPLEEAGIDAARLALDTAAALGDAAPAMAIHAGPVVGGVVGHERPRFEVWGEAVDTAEAVASRAKAGGILVTPAARGLLKDRFELTARGVLDVPGAGQMRICTLTGELSAGATRSATSMIDDR